MSAARPSPHASVSPSADARRRTAAPSVAVTAAHGLNRHAAYVRRVCRDVLRAVNETGSELSAALVHDDEMQRLNRDYRGKDRTTDVLAFALREGEDTSVQEPGLLGDVVVSVPTAARQAEERGHALDRELAELLAHGILHLLGYDHERSPAEARRMFREQRRVLAAIGATPASVARPKRGSVQKGHASRRRT
jgi:rRNA maturation RNase YbeY